MSARLSLSLLVALTACDPDNQQNVDAGPPDAMIDADPLARCLVPPSFSSLGTLPAVEAVVFTNPNNPAQNAYRVVAEIPDSPGDRLQIYLVDGVGAFGSNDVLPGTYPLTAADLSQNGCGACLMLLGDFAGGVANMEYFATSATVVVNSIGGAGSAISVSLQSPSYREIDPFTNMVTGECMTSILSVTVTGTLITPPT